ncbi:putative Mg2+ transporter-C (MgtC) family protein [Clostridium pascui]|uniref:MgtC/SapB family protein n=1 Tax=Clostridium pascui TaxID=46609 RepID=UPI00195BA264|nr:MgtC/SapB family protein [Clostridium pascui]MBM7869507.1 putative Mg2+ transporter-C (MgtC) family protein [Clostridium pascui]
MDFNNLYIQIIVRLFLSIIIGGLIGYEREYKQRPAGFRTHILVCIGATAISIIQEVAVHDMTKQIAANPALVSSLKVDIGRMGAQVITGVGFLGAGTIIHEKGSVRGLTTAASIWTVACIGLAIGLGYYFLSIAAAVGVFLVLVSLKRFEVKFLDKNKIIKIELQYLNNRFVQKAERLFNARSIEVTSVSFTTDEELNYHKAFYTLSTPLSIYPSSLIQDLCTIEEIISVKEYDEE